ncbi:methyltransferase-like protein 24 [Actinia tenebrosa]|uniref:Methyltransferase-like protein 24 n=1 Tax=Actinia tenebrosa TaxID=6105 RepID=A0A6P8H122_ACTTE|nr:methyltransferase-like protein 24 [Actinia tenebrosa]
MKINLRWTVFILLMTFTAIFLYQSVQRILVQLQIVSNFNHKIKRTVKKDIDKRHVNETLKTSSYQIPTTKSINIYEYIEENPADIGTIQYEMARFRRFLATQEAVCEDIRRIGGEQSETWLAPRPFGADGAWDVCFDANVGLTPGSCIVYSFGIGRDFSFDDGMASHGCHVFSFDPTIGQQNHKRPSGVEFFSIGLSDFDQEGSGNISKKLPKSQWKTRTLASVINELGHEKA